MSIEIELTDQILIEKLEDHATRQGVTPSELVQKALQHCAELDLLKNVMGPDGLDPSLEARR